VSDVDRGRSDVTAANRLLRGGRAGRSLAREAGTPTEASRARRTWPKTMRAPQATVSPTAAVPTLSMPCLAMGGGAPVSELNTTAALILISVGVAT
jgi:hypothetical protein